MAGENIDITASNLKTIGEAAATAQGKVTGLTAGMRKFFETIKPENREKFVRALDDPVMKSSAMQFFGMGTPTPGMRAPALPRLPAPPMPPPQAAGVNWGRALLGLVAAPFSPWVGARALSSSGLFGGPGGGGGGGGMFGTGGVGGFMAAYVAVQVAMKGLRFAFDEMAAAIKTGARLYQQAAATAKPTQLLAQLQFAFQGIGLSPETANRLLVGMQSGRRRGMAPFTPEEAQNTVLRAASGVGDVQTMQQLRNMSKEFRDYWADSAYDSKVLSAAAKPMQEMDMLSSRISREWKTMWVGIAMDFLPVLRTALKEIGDMLRGFQRVKESIKDAGIAFELNIWSKMGEGKLKDALGKFIQGRIGGQGVGEPGQEQLFVGGSRPSPTGWEKMGLIISGGVMGADYAKQTAQNTKKIADWTSGVGYFGDPKNKDWTGGVGHFTNLP